MTSKEHVQDVDYCDVMSSSYVDYAMSTIVDRAIPDVRDGLKPVQRRVLYDMYDLGATHDKPYKKTARIVGDTIGRFHPHGDSGVETAIETMAQEFKKPVPLVDGQGNWGSVEGDGAAASRYTECKLTEFSEQALLNFLGSDTVDFQPNYDNTLKEPTVLPAIVPTVLVTGNEGIAVGMRTSIPTFNLSEVVDVNEYVLTHQNVSVDKLLEIMPGPDFVSGGVVCNTKDMRKLYETGQGSLRVRGKVTFWKGKSKEKDKLVVEEIPYSMIGTSLISFMQDVVSLMESGELSGVVDVVNKSGEFARVELVLSRNADCEQIRNTLFAKTKLESVVPVNFLVISNGTPCTVSMVDLLSSYCEFQKQTYRRKFQFELDKITERRDVLLAYVTCCKNIQEVVSIAQNSKSVSEAKEKLTIKYGFSDIQSSAVLSLRIQRLVGMELEKVQSELSDVESRMYKCESVLQSDKKLVRSIVSDIRKVKSKFGYNRRTKLTDVEVASCVKKERKDVLLLFLCDRFSYAHCVDEQTYGRNRDTIQKEFPTVCRTSSLSKVYVFDSQGNLNRVKVSDVPTGQLRAKGITLDVITGNKFDSKSSSVVLAVDEGYVQSVPVFDVLVVTKGGMCKRVARDQLVSTRKCSQYVTLSGSDEVVYVGVCNFESFEVTTSDGRTKVVKTVDVPVKPRSSKGVRIVSFKSPSTTITTVVTSK